MNFHIKLIYLLSFFFIFFIFSAVFSVEVLAQLEKEQNNYDIKVSEIWARETVIKGQATGIFMTIETTSDYSLVGAYTDLGKLEIHTVTIGENNIMQMRQVEKIDIKANEPYEFRPGGYHFMLFDLQEALNSGDMFNITLYMQKASEENEKKKEKVQVVVEVKSLNYQRK